MKDTFFMCIAIAMLVAPLLAAGLLGVVIGFLSRGAVIRRHKQRRQKLTVCPGCAQTAGRYSVCAECLDRLHGRA